MKKIIYFLILNSFCFVHLNTQANPCAGGFLKRLKQFVSRQMGKFETRFSEQVSKKILLSELRNNPEFFSIYSAALPTPPRFGAHRPVLGDYTDLTPPRNFPPETPTQPVTYSAFYTSEKIYTSKPSDPRAKGAKGKSGTFYLALTIRLDVKEDYNEKVYRHWIHWPSNARNAYLSEGTIKDIFNAIYETVYGKSLDWMITNNAFSIIENHTHTRDRLDPEAPEKFWEAEQKLNDLFKFYEDFFDGFRPWVKAIVAKALVRQWPHQVETSQEQTQPALTPFTKFSTLRSMLRNSLGQFSVEQLKTMPPEQIRRLSDREIVEFFNTPEKIRVLDMSAVHPETQVYLLTRYSLWRDSITEAQVQQLDTSTEGIQYVIVPVISPRYEDERPAEQTARISIDTLTDTQIEKINRGVFLHEAFTIWSYILLHNADNNHFREPSGRFRNKLRETVEVEDPRLDEINKTLENPIPKRVMRKPLPKEMTDFIAQQLGFNTEFESMTVEQKRELFKAEVQMIMVDSSDQLFAIIEKVMQENETGNHNWF